MAFEELCFQLIIVNFIVNFIVFFVAWAVRMYSCQNVYEINHYGNRTIENDYLRPMQFIWFLNFWYIW